MTEQPTAWIIMPVVNNEAMTVRAVADCLDQQGVDVKVLVVLQGAVDFRESLEQWAERESRLFVWTHNPPLPSLSATWNQALAFVWEAGGEEALVVNNDVRLWRGTFTHLRTVLHATEALFVTAVGVREKQYEEAIDDEHFEVSLCHDPLQKGGPDFSCFLISRACHQQYPFDERFIPAYCEDLDYHRRLMLGGDGARIFSVNLPYLHYASQTVQQYTPEQREAFARQVAGSRAHYARKWGGAVNQETYLTPFGGTSIKGVTTPELQRAVLAGAEVGAHLVAAPFVGGEDVED